MKLAHVNNIRTREYSIMEESCPFKEKKLQKKAGRPAAFEADTALDEAVCAFWRSGYEGTDLAQIASALGATKPSLYRLFGCKKTLFLEALKHYAEKSRHRYLELLEAKIPLREALQQLLMQTITSSSKPGEPQGCFLACVAVAEAQSHPEAGEIFTQATHQFEEDISKRMARAIDEGDLPQSFPVARRANLFISFILANALRARSGALPQELMDTVDDVLTCVLGQRKEP